MLESVWENISLVGVIEIDTDNRILLCQHTGHPSEILAAFDYAVDYGRMTFSLFCEVGRPYQRAFKRFMGAVVSEETLEFDKNPYIIHKTYLDIGDRLPSEFDYATLTWH